MTIVTDFISLFTPPFTNELKEIYDAKGGPPAIEPETARLIAVLLTMAKPKEVLEIGTSFGFSACYCAQFLAEGGKVTTIERNPALFETARKNFDKMGLAGTITTLEGDALDILPKLSSEGKRYDYIFMDAAKGQYINFLPHCIEMLNPGGLLCADNIFCRGYVTAERKDIPHRMRTAHDRMRAFLAEVMEHPELQAAIVPIGDGLVVATKTKINGGKTMPENKTIESNLKENLSGELLVNALDFVSYLKSIGMTTDDSNRFYYKGELMCILVNFKDEKNPFGMLFICDCPIYEHDGFPIDESVKSFAQKNIQKCRGDKCGCDHKERGATKMVFGKEYNNLCSSEIIFTNPDAEAVEKIKVLMELWKYKLDNIVGYSSQDR